MPTIIDGETICHACRHCGDERRYPRKHLGLFARGDIGFRCKKCTAGYDDFGYDRGKHLVLTRAECEAIEEAAIGQNPQPIRYATSRDAGFDEPS